MEEGAVGVLIPEFEFECELGPEWEPEWEEGTEEEWNCG